jgi:hypothetical protein
MTGIFKFVLTGIGLVLILIGVAALLVFTQAQDFLSHRIGAVMTEAFGAKAEIGGVRLSVRRHAVVLQKFRLGNPPGFQEGDALTCAQIYAVISPKSLISREPVVELLDLQGAEIYSRHETGRGTNLGALSKQLANAPGHLSFKVETLRCEDGKLHLSTSLLPGASVPIPMTKVEIHDLDSGKPVNAAKTTAIFLRTVLRDVLTLKGLGASVYEAIKSELGGGNDTRPAKAPAPPAA